MFCEAKGLVKKQSSLFKIMKFYARVMLCHESYLGLILLVIRRQRTHGCFTNLILTKANAYFTHIK